MLWGGKIASTLLDGVRLDTGAEALLARRPEAVALIDSLRLSDRKSTRATQNPICWSAADCIRCRDRSVECPPILIN